MDVNGLNYAYTVINQAWILYWYGHLLGIYNSKDDMLKDYNFYLSSSE